MGPSPPGLRTLRWDRLGVFSYTKILLILFFKKRLFYPTWLGSILEKRLAETSEPASGKQFPSKMRSNNCQQDHNSFKKCATTIASKIPPTPAVNVEIAARISDWTKLCPPTQHWLQGSGDSEGPLAYQRKALEDTPEWLALARP